MNRIGILTTDTDLVVKTWDSQLAAMTGISGEAARGQRLQELVPGLKGSALLDLIREPLLSGSAQVLAPALHKFLIQCPPAAPSSEFQHMQQRVVVGPLRDEERTVGLVMSIEDVTERLERERRLARDLRDAAPEVRLKAVQQYAVDAPDSTDGFGPLTDALGDDDWRVRRAVVRALASRRDELLVDGIVAALRDGHRNFSLLSSALQLLTLTGVDFTDALIRLMQDPDSDLRIQAALALGTQQRPAAVDALLAAFDDPDPNVRFHAIEAIGRLAAPAAIQRLAEIAESGDFYLAFPAVEALVRINDPLVTPRLVPLLQDPVLGSSAAQALGHLGDEDSVEALTDALGALTVPLHPVIDVLVRIHDRYQTAFGSAEDIEDLVRRRLTPAGLARILDAIRRPSAEGVRPIVVLLGWLRDPAIPAALARLLGSAEARSDVIEAFVRFGPSAVTLLIQQLNADDVETRRASIVALGRIGDRRAVLPLTHVLAHDSLALRVSAISALARLGDPRAFAPLLDLLGDTDVAVRHAAVGALNSIGHPEMEGPVQERLSHPSALVRESAVKIAGYFGYAGCVGAVLRLCADSDEAVRAAALEHLPYFDDPRILSTVASAMERETPRARAAAAKALGALSDVTVIDLLQKALGDPEPWVRYFAAISLGRQPNDASLASLARTAASDSAPQVRVAAVDAIGAIGGSHALTVLMPLAAQEDGEISLAALRVLGATESDAVFPTLRDAIRSTDPARRRAAVEALVQWGQACAVEPLQWAASADSDPAIAHAALSGLATIANQDSSGSRAAVRATLMTLSDSERRAEAIGVLGRLAPSAIPFVAEALNADDPHVRRGVVEVLGRLTHPSASVCLQKALADADAVIRREAVRALSRRGTRGLTRRFALIAKTDVSPAVREAAAAALSRQPDSGENAGE